MFIRPCSHSALDPELSKSVTNFSTKFAYINSIREYKKYIFSEKCLFLQLAGSFPLLPPPPELIINSEETTKFCLKTNQLTEGYMLAVEDYGEGRRKEMRREKLLKVLVSVLYHPSAVFTAYTA